MTQRKTIDNSERPIVKMKSISSDGIVIIEFSDRFLIPDEIFALNNNTYLRDQAIKIIVKNVEN